MNIRTLVVVFLVVVRRASSAVTTLCGQYDTVASVDNRYTFNTDVWGGYSNGVQCIYFDPNTETADNSTWLTSTWTWAQNELEVHSYAHVQLTSTLLPLTISKLDELVVNASYTLAPGNDAASSNDIQGITDLNTRCDVVVDTFLDLDADLSTDATKGSTEIMIWLAAYGGVEPTGNQTSHSISLGGSAFSLFQGIGPTNQTVYSWWPSSNISIFNQDISPMFTYMVKQDLISDALYLGIIAFGTETEHTDNDQNVTWASQIRLDVSEKHADSTAPVLSSSTVSSSHTSSLPSSTAAQPPTSQVDTANQSQATRTTLTAPNSSISSSLAAAMISSSTAVSSSDTVHTSLPSSSGTEPSTSPSGTVQHDSSASKMLGGTTLSRWAVVMAGLMLL